MSNVYTIVELGMADRLRRYYTLADLEDFVGELKRRGVPGDAILPESLRVMFDSDGNLLNQTTHKQDPEW